MTSPMRVVSDTSPISNLAIIGRLDLLLERYGEVIIPPMVREELKALRHADAASRIEAALHQGWLVVRTLPEAARRLALPAESDPGESEALRLALHLGADKILLDDSMARAIALQMGLRMAGLLGELLFAKQSGRVASVAGEIRRLRSEARFFVSAEVEAVILSAAGE